MKEFLKKVKRVWDKIMKLFATEEFVFFFPLGVFVATAILSRSLLFVGISAIWMITVFHGSKERQDG